MAAGGCQCRVDHTNTHFKNIPSLIPVLSIIIKYKHAKPNMKEVYKMESRKIRVAMIGAGDRAMQVIYPAMGDQADVEIAGVCDIDETRRTKAAKLYNIPRQYGQKGTLHYQDMLKELKPDAVAVVGQPHIMYDIWEWSLKNGFHLIVEKPLALSLHQAKMLTWMAEQKNLITQVAFQRRYTPMVVKMRDECLKHGPIVHAVCRFYKYLIEPTTGARDHMMDDCVHSIDTLRWICGGEVVKVESVCKRIGVPDINFISATLHFDNGSTGYLINSWSSGKRVFEVEMHAPGIYVAAEHEDKALLFAKGDVTGIRFDTKQVAGSSEFHVYTGVSALVRDFIDGIKTGQQPQACFQNSLKTMEIAEIILAQALLEKGK